MSETWRLLVDISDILWHWQKNLKTDIDKILKLPTSDIYNKSLSILIIDCYFIVKYQIFVKNWIVETNNDKKQLFSRRSLEWSNFREPLGQKFSGLVNPVKGHVQKSRKEF